MPTPDDPSEMEVPMTRALFATDVDEGAHGAPPDPDGTVEEITRRMTARLDDSDPGSKAAGGSGLAHGSMSAWTNGSAAGTGSGGRGVFGKIEPGQTLYSKYRVLKKLGSGAMGEVWLVRHSTLKSEHALKVIVPNFATNAVALMRFQREFEVMASLRHEHAIIIYDACIDDDGGYIDMEFVDGQTIHDVLSEARSRADLDPSAPLMPLDWIVRVLDQLCEVLQVAHEKGIVHRDLKPSNMMLLSGRKPGKEYLKVLDFGIAKVRDDPESAAGRDQEESENKTQGFIGTPSYGSPEQAMAVVDVDGRADLYSVGIMLYEFVTGRLPFRGNHWQVMSQNATAPPPPFRETNPNLRPIPEVEHAVLRVLAKDRDRRPQTARELFDDFRDAVEAVLPPGAPGLTPPTWDAVPFHAPPHSTSPTLQPTEVDHANGAGRVSHAPETLLGNAFAPDLSKAPAERSSDFGGIVAEPKTSNRSKIGVWVGLLLASVLIIGLIVAVTLRMKKTPEGGGAKPQEYSFVDYFSEIYAPVKGFGEDKSRPDKIRRTTDEVLFVSFAEGIYLPEGYKVEYPTQLVDGWPRVIVRDGIRFIRIQGDIEWIMGAWEAPVDVERRDAPAHPVILSGYYMQETEVTNGQIEEYLKATGKTKPPEWQANFNDLKRNLEPELARRHPAVNLTLEMARAYADYMDGLIPTEAQWEFAARSRGKENRYVWGNQPRPSRELANIEPMGTPTTTPVKKYPKDVTEQGLYDMIGNVQEMCRDAWEPYKKVKLPMPDPCARPHDPEKPEYSIRGAHFASTSDDCATTRRDDHRPENELAEICGFRLVIECPDARKPR